MDLLNELLDQALLLREELQHYIEPFGIPIAEYENAGAAGIHEIHEQQVPLEDAVFANELFNKIECVPIPVVRSMCLASSYLLLGLGMIKAGQHHAVSVLMRSTGELGFVRGMAYGVIHKDSQNARYAAFARHATDPKQKDKALVRECWSDWQKEPGRYKGKSAFARDMLNKFESLESQRVIERWCKEWESVPF